MPARDDLSPQLVHLTSITWEQQNAPFRAAANVLLEIMRDCALIGGRGMIRGGYRCVCFSEAPLPKLSLILASRDHGFRYSPFGVMVKKQWLFDQGGRPVIYQPEADFGLLPEELWYRHVQYDPPRVDFTWEREWRIKIDRLPLRAEDVTLIVPNREWLRRVRLDYLQGIGNLDEYLHWHFVVLEDLGVEIIEPEPAQAAPRAAPQF